MFAALVAMAALTLGIQAVLAHMLLLEGRGAYAVCVAFGTLLALLLTPGTAYGTQYLLMVNQISPSCAVASAVGSSFVAGGLGVVLGVPIIYSDFALVNKADTRTYLLALVLVPTTALSFALDQQLVGKRRFKSLAAFLLLRVITNLLALLILVWYLDLGVDGAVISLGVSHCLMAGACLLYMRRKFRVTLEIPRRKDISGILGYGLRYHVAQIGIVIEPQITIVALSLLSERGEIGLFTTASSIMLGFLMISNSVSTALLPRIAGKGWHELVALCMRLVWVLTACALLAFAALSSPLVRLLLPEAFLSVVPLIWIISPGILALAASGILMTYFKGSNRPGACSWAVILGISVNVVMLLLLYPRIGVDAAAWSMTIGMLCRLLFLSVIFSRLTLVPWLSIWLPRRNDAAYLWDSIQPVFGRPKSSNISI